jgi:hypothetical protein
VTSRETSSSSMTSTRAIDASYFCSRPVFANL